MSSNRVLGISLPLLPFAFLLASARPAGPPPTARAADPIHFMRDPQFYGGTIAFSYQGDLWLVNADGSNPRRLTANPAHDVTPRFSPDGKWIAFSSDRQGNMDVYVMPAAGGEPKQLTWYPGDDLVQYWTPDGKGVVITSNRSSHPFGSPLYVVPIDGGIPTAMPMDFGRSGMLKQDATLVAFDRFGMNDTRHGYRGNNSGDVWVEDLRTKKFTQLTDPSLDDFRQHVQDGKPMWGADGMIYFSSERSGIFNIWKISPTGGAPVQVTNHRTGGIKYPSISPDGKTITYTEDYELYTLDVPGGQPHKVTVNLSVDPPDNLFEYVRSDNRADGFSPSPAGDQLAVDFRGEIFVVPADAELGDKTQVTHSPRRERFEQFSPDGKQLAYISDESGDEEVWVWDATTGTKRQLSHHESYKNDFLWSPDGSHIAFVGANRLFEIDVAAAKQRELEYNIAGGYNLNDYSPDGKWLLYTRSDADQNSDVYLYDITAAKEYDLTPNPFRDLGGELTPDGRNLVFESNRDGGTNHLFVVSLAKLSEDPEDPLVRARHRSPDEQGGGGRGGQGGGGGAAVPQAGPIHVDADGIADRAIQLTSGDNGVGQFFVSRDGRTIYFTSSPTTKARLCSPSASMAATADASRPAASARSSPPATAAGSSTARVARAAAAAAAAAAPVRAAAATATSTACPERTTPPAAG